MHFASDNTAGASPTILQALVDANAGSVPSYGGDAFTKRATARLQSLFDCDLAVAYVATGTAANALALATLVPPGGVTFCHAAAHIIDEECAAPEFFTNGGKIVGVAGSNGKIDPAALHDAVRRFPRGIVRQAQAACLSLSHATESGTLYTLDEIKALTDIAHAAGLAVHMDGARFANAVASLGCSPADSSWRAGVDVLSFGATKNGTLACEAVLVFDAARAAHLPFLQKRAGHVLSKNRLIGAQMDAYLANDHWLALARHANAMASRLAEGLGAIAGVRFPWTVEANELFPILPTPLCQALRHAGGIFHDWEHTLLDLGSRPGPEESFVRMVCSFATAPKDVDDLLAAAQNHVGGVARLPH